MVKEMESTGVLVPKEAYDIGDTDERANPRAEDLDYVVGGQCHQSGNTLHDGPNKLLAGGHWIESDTLIEDVSEIN